MRQRAVDRKVLAALPDLVEDEQGRVLRIAQHVVFDATLLRPAGLDIGAEQRFEFIGHLWLGVGMEDEAVGHGACLWLKWFINLNAIPSAKFMTLKQVSIALRAVFPAGLGR
ncbi:hypothetical protein D9M68_826890 [compost metagenome]